MRCSSPLGAVVLVGGEVVIVFGNPMDVLAQGGLDGLQLPCLYITIYNMHQVFGKLICFGQTKFCESFLHTSLKPILQNSHKKMLISTKFKIEDNITHSSFNIE